LENPELVLGDAKGLVILDEIQQMPGLFTTLRVLVDRPGNQAKFLILDSASPYLIRQASESLAGRIEFIELGGFDISEAGIDVWENLWVRGGFPRSFLANSSTDSIAWREGFIRTFLERDLPQFGINIPATAMRRFWNMLAHYHGQTWNTSELSRAMGLSDKTVRSYLDIMSGAFMVRQLQPWYENIGKRQVRAPKIYVRDSGLLHNLLNIPNLNSLFGHPKVGASWEGYIIEQVLNILNPIEANYWGVHGVGEIDLLIFSSGKRYGIEARFSEAPIITRGLHVAFEDLGLQHLWIIYPGENDYPITKNISVLPFKQILSLVDQIR
jgi:predicted AAA+ superfamily ATPase